MGRDYQLLSTELDDDALACADAEQLDGVERHGRPIENRWPLIARAGLELRWLPPTVARLHTFGEPALRAAAIGWRGAITHTRGWFEQPVPNRLQVKLGDRLTLQDSPDPSPSPRSNVVDRDFVRDQLGVTEHDVLIFAPGRVRPNSGHRLAVWAAAILHFRNARYRLVVRDRGDLAPLWRFARNLSVPHMVRSSRLLDDRSLAVGCDLAISCVPTTRFERTPITACGEVPLLAPRTVIGIVGAGTAFAELRARPIARQILERFEAALPA
ncbi:MAG: hypothetical protein QM770_11110 [Tepidisphaeraceae bacterium]